MTKIQKFDDCICVSIILFTSFHETGIKLLLSTPTSYCEGNNISNLEKSKPLSVYGDV